MNINVIIGRDTLGDVNTEYDNLRFVSACQAAIESEYPNAIVRVELGEHSHHPSTDVEEITNAVWDRADY